MALLTTSTQLPNFLKITQNKGHFAVQGQYHTAVAAPSAAPVKVPFPILIGTTLTTVLHYRADCDAPKMTKFLKNHAK